MALLGVIPLAGMLGHGTETIALYTGDALGGLINAKVWYIAKGVILSLWEATRILVWRLFFR